MQRELRRADTPERYVQLCERLFEPLPAQARATVKPTAAEIEFGLRQLRGDLARLAQDGRNLSPIAQRYAITLDNLVALDARRPKGSAWVFAAVEVGLGFGTHNRDQISKAGSDVLRESKSIWNWTQEVQQTARGLEVARLELLQLSPIFSGPTVPAKLISWRFAETTPGLFELETCDWVYLTNTSGHELSNCVVNVRLTNPDGESAQNFHFVRQWAPGETRVAKYVAPAAFAKTVPDVSRVAVSIWTAQGSNKASEITKPRFGWKSPD